MLGALHGAEPVSGQIELVVVAFQLATSSFAFASVSVFIFGRYVVQATRNSDNHTFSLTASFDLLTLARRAPRFVVSRALLVHDAVTIRAGEPKRPPRLRGGPPPGRRTAACGLRRSHRRSYQAPDFGSTASSALRS